jgi:hypothetical protein
VTDAQAASEREHLVLREPWREICCSPECLPGVCGLFAAQNWKMSGKNESKQVFFERFG